MADAMRSGADYKKKRFLITGGNGFIGSHLSKALFERGDFVRILDHNPPLLDGEICNEFVQGNLCDPHACRKAVAGIDAVLHLGANMGGMGTIHQDNEVQIYLQNHTMTLNILNACIAASVQTFFYASSACVYPELLQSFSAGSASSDVSLREEDVWAQLPPRPQGLYGLEKLHSEILLQNHCSISLKIARFHNIYGPGGSWSNGREKAPAALLRKAFAARHASEPTNLEIWGDGTQSRSFLYIDDAVDGVLRLLDSDCCSPVNIGSTESVTIKQLADIALDVAGVDASKATFKYNKDRPLGVSARNSNNEFVQTTLRGWSPSVSLYEGMRRTGQWISKEMASFLDQAPPEKQQIILSNFRQSQLLYIESEKTVFAIVLPVTSRGTSTSQCLTNLRRFSKSLINTTWRDTDSVGAPFAFRIYLAIDEMDVSLHGIAEAVVREAGISDIVVRDNFCHPPGHVCSLWRDCAEQAWRDGCDYITLLGDDVELLDEGWMRTVHALFADISFKSLPYGFGCVAFTDISFPGMPTFPIIGRFHMDLFEGKVVPDAFINQDGDPFLFQLYRRWAASVMMSCRIKNYIGGSGDARYNKQPANDWTFGPLRSAIARISSEVGPDPQLSLDVVVPSYRVQLPFLETILNLDTSSTCTTMFIIIIDDPHSAAALVLDSKFGSCPDVRIRINTSNLGASASRNRGMRESCADWILLLDDDVTPSSNILIEAEKAIRREPLAAGFVGDTLFPCANTLFKAAAHVSGVTYFWDIASKRSKDDDLPWGVTANLLVRRENDGVEFRLEYPKTGGGEDIDFCRERRARSKELGGKGFVAAPKVKVVHPWWNNGKRDYWRFYMWSVGDGALIARFPEYAYQDFAPNSAECGLLCAALLLLSVLLMKGELFVVAVQSILSVLMANIMHDIYRHLWRNASRLKAVDTSLTGFRWFLAVLESSFIRMFSELGRLRGIITRREFNAICKRFDWFTGRLNGVNVSEERQDGVQRILLAAFILNVLLKACSYV